MRGWTQSAQFSTWRVDSAIASEFKNSSTSDGCPQPTSPLCKPLRRAVTPAGLHQEPPPFEKDKVIYATTTAAVVVDSARSGGRLQSLRLVPRVSRVHALSSLSMYFPHATTTSTSSGAALKVSSCSPLCTSSSPLRLYEKSKTDLRRTRVRENGGFLWRSFPCGSRGWRKGPSTCRRKWRPVCTKVEEKGPVAVVFFRAWHVGDFEAESLFFFGEGVNV